MNRITETILKILHDSKETGVINRIDDNMSLILERFGARAKETGWFVSRDIRMKLALQAVSEGVEIETVVNQMNWKDFEGFVARILEENGYYCVESLRRRGNATIRGLEIDVVGVKSDRILSIDAKMWGIRKGKRSALVNAAEKHSTRTQRFATMLESFSDRLKLTATRYWVIPVIVTWLVEDVQFHNDVPLVPIFQLNKFILELDVYEDMLVRYEALV